MGPLVNILANAELSRKKEPFIFSSYRGGSSVKSRTAAAPCDPEGYSIIDLLKTTE